MKQLALKGISLMAAAIILTACNTPKDEKKEEKTETAHQHKEKTEEKGHEHDHDHGPMPEEEQKIHDGYFKDDQVKDRELTDWEGKWQSVYPYLQDGTLDKVFEKKAKEDKSMTAKEYKDYYTTGYKTNISHIEIGEKKVTYTEGKDKYSGEYEYDGKEILKYEKGNRGVRFIFKKVSGDEKAPKFIQFSDHLIAPERALHYHIYMGDDREELLEELENWPTYYPSDLDGKEVQEEMLAH